jgi:PAS domain S-box-containing protein
MNLPEAASIMAKTKKSMNEVYELALQAAPSGIIVVDEAGEIRYTNQTLADMFGYRVEELVDEPVEILIPDQFAAAHRRHMENYARAPRSRDMGTGRDLEGITRDGNRIPLEIGLRPTQTPSGPVVVATVVDITVRKAIEDRLHRHEQELEQLGNWRTRSARKSACSSN